MVAGRPPMPFCQETADFICDGIADGKSLRGILREHPELPTSSTIFKWLNQNAEFAKQYTQARVSMADALTDDMMAISDDGLNDTYIDENGFKRTDKDVIARSRLRVETRKWLASKMQPKKYGERIAQEITGSDGAPLITNLEVTFKKPEEK